jgi:hypothetical protein
MDLLGSQVLWGSDGGKGVQHAVLSGVASAPRARAHCRSTGRLRNPARMAPEKLAIPDLLEVSRLPRNNCLSTAAALSR